MDTINNKFNQDNNQDGYSSQNYNQKDDLSDDLGDDAHQNSGKLQVYRYGWGAYFLPHYKNVLNKLGYTDFSTYNDLGKITSSLTTKSEGELNKFVKDFTTEWNLLATNNSESSSKLINSFQESFSMENTLYSKLIWQTLEENIINFPEIFPLETYSRQLSTFKKFNMEIGIGNGGFIRYMAKNHTDEFFVGFEVFRKILKTATERIFNRPSGLQPNNIKLIHFDANMFIHTLPPFSVDNFYINFPDPWHKKKHKKRRLLKEEFLNVLAFKLKTGGCINIATDHRDYSNEISENIVKILPIKSTHEMVYSSEFTENLDSYYKTKYYNKFVKTDENNNKNLYYYKYIKR